MWVYALLLSTPANIIYCTNSRPSSNRRCQRQATTPPENHFLCLSALKHRTVSSTHLQLTFAALPRGGRTDSTQPVPGFLDSSWLFFIFRFICTAVWNNWNLNLFSDKSSFYLQLNQRVNVWKKAYRSLCRLLHIFTSKEVPWCRI